MVKNEDVIKEFVNYGTDETIKTKNVFFEQDVLFSYGYHFPMAVRLKDGWIINKSKCSSTTSKHQYYLKRLISGNIQEMNTHDLKEFLLSEIARNEKGMRFITFEELHKLKMLGELEK
jgi:hypothetical protein